MQKRAWLLALLLIPMLSAAQESSKQRQVVNSMAFLSAHPDLRWRREGILAYDKRQLPLAAQYFQRAARFADKPSQAMYAEMLWLGEGVAADRALAYAWMDLAAERAYLPFLAKRERYWRELGEADRKRALVVGQAVYAEYGDAVAKPRLEKLLERAMRKVTGSRTGFVGGVKILVPGPNGLWQSIDGSQYYASKYWKPEQYWRWQDRTWKDPPTAHVDVQAPEQIEDSNDNGH